MKKESEPKAPIPFLLHFTDYYSALVAFFAAGFLAAGFFSVLAGFEVSNFSSFALSFSIIILLCFLSYI